MGEDFDTCNADRGSVLTYFIGLRMERGAQIWAEWGKFRKIHGVTLTKEQKSSAMGNVSDVSCMTNFPGTSLGCGTRNRSRLAPNSQAVDKIADCVASV